MVPCLRNFHPRTTRTTFFFLLRPVLRRLFSLSFTYERHPPVFLSLPVSSPLSVSRLHASSTSSQPILVALSRPRQFPFSRSAFQFIPFAGFASLFLPPLTSEILNHGSLSLWSDGLPHNTTMARRLEARRQARSSSLPSIVGVNRQPNRWLTERGNILKEIFVLGKDRVCLILLNFDAVSHRAILWNLWKTIHLYYDTLRFSLNFFLFI